MEPCKHESDEGVSYTEAHAFDHVLMQRFLSVSALIETPADATRLAGWLVEAADWLAESREAKEEGR